MKKRYREEQIIGFLKEAESGISVEVACPQVQGRVDLSKVR